MHIRFHTLPNLPEPHLPVEAILTVELNPRYNNASKQVVARDDVMVHDLEFEAVAGSLVFNFEFFVPLGLQRLL
jgi:hypothetical protein